MQLYHFKSRFCKEGESVAKYLAELRALAEFCNYSASLEDIYTNKKQATEKRVDDAQLVAEYQLFWTGKPGTTPLVVTMFLNGNIHNMEIDTGTSVSVMSQSTCQQRFCRRKLDKTSIQLKT